GKTSVMYPKKRSFLVAPLPIICGWETVGPLSRNWNRRPKPPRPMTLLWRLPKATSDRWPRVAPIFPAARSS
ncbi:MAG TPA: hypothetical protein DCY58_12695, partial [Acetobacterium sp.]|nr:hypothetical protein [Acetobacterium sp.]